jgi:hypothetical protein
MARDTGSKIKATELQIENQELITRNYLLQSRLELVAELLARHGFIQDTPYARYCFATGAAIDNFPSIKPEFTDIDGNPSNS